MLSRRLFVGRQAAPLAVEDLGVKVGHAADEEDLEGLFVFLSGRIAMNEPSCPFFDAPAFPVTEEGDRYRLARSALLGDGDRATACELAAQRAEKVDASRDARRLRLGIETGFVERDGPVA